MFSLAPVTAQGWAIGIAAFILSIAFGFLLLSGVRDRKGVLMTYIVGLATVWAWFGFTYGLTSNPELARNLRLIDGVALFYMVPTMVIFSFSFLEDLRPLTFAERVIRDGFFVFSVTLSVWYLGDLFGQHMFAGDVNGLPSQTLAPVAGPFTWLEVFQNVLGVACMSYPLFMRVRLDPDKKSPGRRQALVFLFTFSLGTFSACTRWAPWYGIQISPIFGFFSVPLIIGGMFYLIKNYKLFNVQVLTTQLLVFSTWVFVFFRIILNPTSFDGTLPDVFLLLGLIILGVLLMRSVTRELRSREEMEVAHREQAIDHAKTEFISIAAHQLRTPLAAIKWAFSVLLTNASNFTSEQRGILEKGQKRAEALVDIVNDLLDIQTMSTGKFRYAIGQTNVSAIVKEAADAFEETAALKHLQLTVDTPPEPILVTLDRHKIELALQNLIDNAIKYTKQGYVRITCSRTQSGVSIIISDSGIGVPQEDQERIFQKFFRSPEATKLFVDGSGLGLFIVKRIIEDHGGTISVQSRPGEGTIVTVRLPTIAAIAEPAQE